MNSLVYGHKVIEVFVSVSRVHYIIGPLFELIRQEVAIDECDLKSFRRHDGYHDKARIEIQSFLF